MPLGVHVSIEGGVSEAVPRAVDLGCDALQCFSANPRGWQTSMPSADEARRFKKNREESGLKAAFVHASYLINMSSPAAELFGRSVKALEAEIKRTAFIGADAVVVHLGSSRGVEGALERVLTALEAVMPTLEATGVELLLENTAGAGHTTGADLNDVGFIFKKLGRRGKKLFGFCFDTCHAFAAGYPLKTANDVAALFKEMDRVVGMERLRLVHLNDSKGACDSKLDRHEHIGKGRIGLGGFKAFLSRPEIKDVPLILETPKDSATADRRNLAIVRKMM